MKLAIVFASLLLPIVAVHKTVSVQNDKPYKTVKVFDQVWMAENLNVSTYRNGDPIPEVQDAKEWKKLKTGAWCYYENKTENGTIYGKMYNWFAVNDPRGLAPEGFHIPSDAEWCVVTQTVTSGKTKGTPINSGKNLKSKTGWKEYVFPKETIVGNGIDLYGFNGLGGGLRNLVGAFQRITEETYWWTSTNNGSDKAWCFSLDAWTTGAGRTVDVRKCGFYVRCIKD